MQIHDLASLKTYEISKKNGNGIGGVYLWGVKLKGRYIPIYVGEAKNLYERIYSHLCNWKGGAYRVPEWDKIINSNSRIGQLMAKDNLLYFPDGAHNYVDFLLGLEIQNTIQKVLHGFFCVLFPLPKNSDLKNEENLLASHIGLSNLISSHNGVGLHSENFNSILEELNSIGL